MSHECIDGCDVCEQDKCIKADKVWHWCGCLCHVSDGCYSGHKEEFTREPFFVPATMLAAVVIFVVTGVVFCLTSQGCARFRCDDAGLACETDASVDTRQ